ncbi:MAG: ATP-dependent metallopeptidase FtsH/Yme1/Tma family protein, partial [Pseudomonadota bacterium]
MGNTRNLVFWVVLFLLIVALFNMFANNPSGSENQRTYSQFIQSVESGQVREVMIDGETITVIGSDDVRYTTVQPRSAMQNNELVDKLINANVEVVAQPQEQS